MNVSYNTGALCQVERAVQDDVFVLCDESFVWRVTSSLDVLGCYKVRVD